MNKKEIQKNIDSYENSIDNCLSKNIIRQRRHNINCMTEGDKRVFELIGDQSKKSKGFILHGTLDFNKPLTKKQLKKKNRDF